MTRDPVHSISLSTIVNHTHREVPRFTILLPDMKFDERRAEIYGRVRPKNPLCLLVLQAEPHLSCVSLELEMYRLQLPGPVGSVSHAEKPDSIWLEEQSI